SIALSVVIRSESASAGEVMAARLVNQISASSTRSATGISQKNIITTSFPSEGRGAKSGARSSLQLINSAGSHRVSRKFRRSLMLMDAFSELLDHLAVERGNV